jgi:hypothetical protein
MSIFGFTGSAAADGTGEDAAVKVKAVGGITGGEEDIGAKTSSNQRQKPTKNICR